MERLENQGQGGLQESSTYVSVNSPSHYTQHPSGVECKNIAQHFNFNCGNVIKYIWRQGLKNGESSLKDLMKARAYIDFEIERVKNEEATNIRNKQEQLQQGKDYSIKPPKRHTGNVSIG